MSSSFGMLPAHGNPSGGRVVNLLACGARGLDFQPWSRNFNFRDYDSPASKLQYD